MPIKSNPNRHVVQLPIWALLAEGQGEGRRAEGQASGGYERSNLCNNGSKFPTGSWDTMSSRTITSRERLPRNDEGSGIGPKILEKVGETVKHDEAFNPGHHGCKSVISKTYWKARVLAGKYNR